MKEKFSTKFLKEFSREFFFQQLRREAKLETAAGHNKIQIQIQIYPNSESPEGTRLCER